MKTTLTYKILCLLGFKYPIEDYGDVSLWKVLKQFFINWYHRLIINAMNWAILEPFNPRKLRPAILRKLGAKVGKDVFIGDYVRVDLNHSDLIEIEDGYDRCTTAVVVSPVVVIIIYLIFIIRWPCRLWILI